MQPALMRASLLLFHLALACHLRRPRRTSLPPQPAPAPPRQLPGREVAAFQLAPGGRMPTPLRNLESTAITTRELKETREGRFWVVNEVFRCRGGEQSDYAITRSQPPRNRCWLRRLLRHGQSHIRIMLGTLMCYVPASNDLQYCQNNGRNQRTRPNNTPSSDLSTSQNQAENREDKHQAAKRQIRGRHAQ